MKFLVLFACVAAASAVNLVAYPNGAVAPAKTPEVVAAEAAHFAAKGAIPYAAGYPYGYAGEWAGYNGYNGYYNGAYPYHAGALVEYANGAVAPAKTPEVVAAEAAHFAAKGALPYATGYPYGYAGAWAGYNGYNGYYNGAYPYHAGALVGYANGAVAPAKTPEVVAAEAAHFAAHGVAPIAPLAYAAGYPYAPLAYAGLVAHPNGAVVPVEPADVVAARNEHLAAHASA